MQQESLVSLIQESLTTNWEHPAFSNYEENSISFGETATRIKAIHNFYRASNIQKGDKVALLGRNHKNWAVIYLATITYGAIIVPILPEFSTKEVDFILEHSDSKFLFCSDQIYFKLKEDNLRLGLIYISLNNFQLLHGDLALEGVKTLGIVDHAALIDKDTFCLNPINLDELAVISYTSGTSGNSKGVMLSHGSIWSNTKFGWDSKLELGPGDRIVSFLPMAHAYGCLFEFLAPFALGCHITFLSKIPSPKIIMKAFGEIKPKLILAVPLIIEKIYKKQIAPTISKPLMKVLLKIPGINSLIHKKIREKLTNVFGGKFIEIIIGGAAFNAEIEKFFMKIGFRITVGYGMTECGPLISYSGWKDHVAGGAGKVVKRMECRIDSADEMKIAGEIQVRGKNVMLGYYKNTDATQEVTTDDGWLRTGDLGVIDKYGHVHVRGRSKSMILGASGQNIYPEEIESVVNNIPYVQECVVRGNKGRIETLIYPDYELARLDGLGKEEVCAKIEQQKGEVNQHLSSYCKVAIITFVDEEFAKTPKKSIKRYLYEL